MADEKDLGKNIADGAADVAGAGVNAAKGALGAVGGILGGIAAKATETAEGALETAKGAVDNVVDSVGDAAEGAIDKAKELAGNLPGGISDAAQGAVDKVQDLAGGAMDAAKDAAQNVVGAAGGAIEGAVDMAQDAVGGAADLAKGALSKAQGLGAGALGAGAAVIGGAAALAGNASKGAVDAASGTINAASEAVHNVVDEGKKTGGFLIPLLLALGVMALAWFGFKSFTGTKVAPVETAQTTAPAWLTSIGDKLKSQFSWLSLGHNGGAVVASGEAADKNTKDAALAAIALEVEASEGKGASVIDNITIAGSKEAPIGAALAALGANPDVAACGKAFTDTMAGRTINFATGKAAVSEDSASLLNALTGIATACEAHKIEIAGHTDSRGDDAANQAFIAITRRCR